MKKILSAVCLVILFIAACNKPAPKLTLFIPKDAAVVFTIDTKAILDKVASSGFTIDSLVNLFSKNDKEAISGWNDIKNSGIDLDEPLYIFSKQNSSIQNGRSENSALIAEVDDSKKLESFLKKQKPANNITAADKYKYMQLNNGCLAGFTDKVLIISYTAKNGNATEETALAQQQLTTLFTQKEDASIASVSEFKDAIAKPGDIHFYTNTSNSLNGAPVPGASKLNELLQNSYTAGVINFEKGKMTGSSETHYSKTLSDILNKYPSKEISTDMIKKYPGELSGFGIISFNPHVLIDILHYTGFDMMADGFAQNIGFTTNDVVNAFSGDIAVMFSPRLEKTTDSFSPPNPGFLLNMQIGDKAAFDKVINGLLAKQILTKHGNEYELGLAGGHGFVIEADNASLYISSSDEMIKAYETATNKATLPDNMEKKVSGKSMAVYVNINNLLTNKSVKDSSVDMHLNDTYYAFKISQAAKETFKNFIVTTSTNNNKVFKTDYELNFVNDNENSLAAFTKFMVLVHAEEMH